MSTPSTVTSIKCPPLLERRNEGHPRAPRATPRIRRGVLLWTRATGVTLRAGRLFVSFQHLTLTRPRVILTAQFPLGPVHGQQRRRATMTIEFGVARGIDAQSFGQPGQRTFRLRILGASAESASLWLEKEQMQALSLCLLYTSPSPR